MRIDAHQHFWHYNPVRDAWITEDMQPLRNDFLPPHLAPLLQQSGFDGCVAVQAAQLEEETLFLLSLADQFDFIKGVVGWVDLTAPNIEERLHYFSSFQKLKGFRHVLQGEAQRDFMLRTDFLRGLSLLHNFHFTYDILIHHDQLRYVPELVAQFPRQRFILDHLAKPLIKAKELDQWAKEMEDASRYQNLHCKVSGMVTEADWKSWKAADFSPYLDVVTSCFGMDRLLFGSDWPVCLLAADYGQVVALVHDYFAKFSEKEQEKFFGGNATAFYNLLMA